MADDRLKKYFAIFFQLIGLTRAKQRFTVWWLYTENNIFTIKCTQWTLWIMLILSMQIFFWGISLSASCFAHLAS